MKIKELIKKGGMTNSMVNKVKTYSEEVDIPMEQYVKLIDTSVMFKKLHGFYSLKSLLDVFDSAELVMLYTTIAEHSEIVLFSCKKGKEKYTIAGTLSVDTMSAGKEKIPSKATLEIHNDMLDRAISDFGFYDFQIGFSSRSMNASTSLISTLANTQVEKTKLDTNKEYKLGLIIQTKNGLNLSVQNIEYNSVLDNVDMLYENIDEEYLETLLEAIHTKKKGNIIFSGAPGTGKTYFIRKIIKDYYDKYEEMADDDDDDDEGSALARMFNRNKNDLQKLFLYVPVNLAHVFSNPEFVSLLQDAATEYPKGIVIILEDAEKVLESREKNGSNYAVSELLEMSDGMLNDIVSTQFIFTYNTHSDNIDKALLRPGRLLALKEFKKLSPEKANILAKELNIPEVYREDVTIAEVFKELAIEEETILIDNKENKKEKIGF